MDWPWSRLPQRTPKQVAASPRLRQRFNPVGLSCRLGDVIDLSATGARIRCTTKPAIQLGDGIRLSISNGTSKIEIRASVVWVRRVRESKEMFDLGLNFIELTPELIADLVEMARFGFLRPKPAAAATATSGASAATATSKPTGSVSGATSGGPAKASGSSSSAKTRPASDSGAVTASIEVEDLYAVLGVPSIATSDQIHTAFRLLARKLHPDRNKAADADQQFARVSKAYSVLRDAELRRRYDAMLNGKESRAA